MSCVYLQFPAPKSIYKTWTKNCNISVQIGKFNWHIAAPPHPNPECSRSGEAHTAKKLLSSPEKCIRQSKSSVTLNISPILWAFTIFHFLAHISSHQMTWNEREKFSVNWTLFKIEGDVWFSGDGWTKPDSTLKGFQTVWSTFVELHFPSVRSTQCILIECSVTCTNPFSVERRSFSRERFHGSIWTFESSDSQKPDELPLHSRNY